MLPNLVLFQGMDATGTNHLWETDGTASGTFALTPISGEPGYGFAPDPGASLDLMVFNDQVLFNGRYSITNYGLWTTDGATTGTKQLTGIAGANSAGIFTANVSPDFTLYNGVVLFSGFDTAGDYGLWTTNGTAAGTSEITVNGAASTGVNPSDMTVFNASVLFNGFDSAGNQGLWTTNGAASGAAEITGIIGVRTTGGLDPTDMTVFNGDILFNGADCPGCGKQMGRELTGVTGASASGIAPSDLTVFDGKVLFSGLDFDRPLSVVGDRRHSRWHAGADDDDDDGVSSRCRTVRYGGLRRPSVVFRLGREWRGHEFVDDGRHNRGNTRGDSDCRYPTSSAVEWWAPILDLAGTWWEQATSTTTAIPTSCGRTRTVRPRSGK